MNAVDQWTCHSCGHQQRIAGVCVVCGELLLVKSAPEHRRGFCPYCRTAGVPNTHLALDRCFTKTVRRRLWGLSTYIAERRRFHRMYEISRRMDEAMTMVEDFMEVHALFSVWHRDKRREVMDDPHSLHDLRVEEHRAGVRGTRPWESTDRFKERIGA